MKKRLLVVKAAFPARGGELEVLPPVSSDALPPSPFEVVLRAPGGTEQRVTATAVLSHVRGPSAPHAMLRLTSVEEAAVPPGTEIWLPD